MVDRVVDQHPHANHHSFHIPNAHARSALASEEEYSAIPGEEEDAIDGHVDITQPILTGVEGSDTWETLTRYKRGLVRLAFGILGAIVLLPFNTVITPSEYYRALLKGSARETTFLSWLIAVYNVSCIVFGAHATATMHKRSVARRIKSSSTIIIAVLILTTALTSFAGRPEKTDSSGIIFGIMLLLTLVLSAATSYLQLAVVTLANGYGPTCMGTMLSGQGVVGASVSLIQLIAASSASVKRQDADSEEAHRAAIGFFAVNTAFMIFGLASFLILQRNKLYKEMQSRITRAKSNLVNTLLASERPQVGYTTSPSRSVTGFYRYMSLHTQQTFSRILVTQKKVILACFSIAYIFVITLSIFPSLTARIHSTHDTLPDIVFVALHFFIFNISDFIGRSISSIIPRLVLIKSLVIISLCCILRTTFIPLFLLCNVKSTTTNAKVPLENLSFFLLTAALGISNGLLATNIFVIGPRQDDLDNVTEQELAAGLISWWLTLGLAIGSLASFIVASYV